jgi:hypothetical protein
MMILRMQIIIFYLYFIYIILGRKIYAFLWCRYVASTLKIHVKNFPPLTSFLWKSFTHSRETLVFLVPYAKLKFSSTSCSFHCLFDVLFYSKILFSFNTLFHSLFRRELIIFEWNKTHTLKHTYTIIFTRERSSH